LKTKEFITVKDGKIDSHFCSSQPENIPEGAIEVEDFEGITGDSIDDFDENWKLKKEIKEARASNENVPVREDNMEENNVNSGNNNSQYVNERNDKYNYLNKLYQEKGKLQEEFLDEIFNSWMGKKAISKNELKKYNHYKDSIEQIKSELGII
jgi:hypothetical protein